MCAASFLSQSQHNTTFWKKANKCLIKYEQKHPDKMPNLRCTLKLQLLLKNAPWFVNFATSFAFALGNRPAAPLPTIHSGLGLSQEAMMAGNGNFNSQEALAAFLHQQQMANNRTSQPDQRWFGVEWNEANPSGNSPVPSNHNQNSSSNVEVSNFHAPASNYPIGLHTSNNQAAWSQAGAGQSNGGGHSTGSHTPYRSEQPTIEALSAEIAALLTLPGTSLSQINSLQALLMGSAGSGAGAGMNIAATQRQQVAPRVPSGNHNNSNWLRGGDDSAGGGYGSDGMQGYVNAGVATDPWLHPLSGSNGGASRLSGMRRTSGEDSAPGSPASRNVVVNHSPWSGTLAGLNGDAFTSGMGSPSVPGRQHSLYKVRTYQVLVKLLASECVNHVVFLKVFNMQGTSTTVFHISDASDVHCRGTGITTLIWRVELRAIFMSEELEGWLMSEPGILFPVLVITLCRHSYLPKAAYNCLPAKSDVI